MKPIYKIVDFIISKRKRYTQEQRNAISRIVTKYIYEHNDVLTRDMIAIDIADLLNESLSDETNSSDINTGIIRFITQSGKKIIINTHGTT